MIDWDWRASLNFFLHINRKFIIIFGAIIIFLFLIIIFKQINLANVILENTVKSSSNADISEPKFAINNESKKIYITASQGNFINKDEVLLNENVRYELVGVVKYTHFALMVTGPHRLILDKFFKDQASESLSHAQQAGEILTGLGGHPSLTIPNIEETNKHSVKDLLVESLNHEEKAILLYNDLLHCSENKSLYIEEYSREMIKTEEMHSIEIKKMLRDYD